MYSHINIILLHNFTMREGGGGGEEEKREEIQSICLVSTFRGTAYGLHILINLMTGTLWNVRKLNIFLSTQLTTLVAFFLSFFFFFLAFAADITIADFGSDFVRIFSFYVLSFGLCKCGRRKKKNCWNCTQYII